MASKVSKAYFDRFTSKMTCPQCAQAGAALWEVGSLPSGAKIGPPQLLSLSNGFHVDETHPQTETTQILCDRCDARIAVLPENPLPHTEAVAGRSPQRSEKLAGDEMHGLTHMVTQETIMAPAPPPLAKP